MSHTYIGSQPIYNKDLRVYAYQLLFHSSEQHQSSHEDHATSTVLLTCLAEIGLDRLVGKHKASINFTRNFIIGDMPIPKLTHKIIVEIENDIELDQDIIDALHSLIKTGYTLSIPEALYLEHFSEVDNSELIVKFDITTTGRDDIKQRLSRIKKKNILRLAENINAMDDYTYCSELDFDLIHGLFLSKPNMVKHKEISSSKAGLLQILQKLQDENTDTKEIDQLISTDVNLSFRLLKYANSSSSGVNTRIESIQHAVSLLGLNTVKMLTSLLVLSSMSDKPPELFRQGLIRAKFCENIAESINTIDNNTAFTAGLFSIIDALLDMQIDGILAQLPLNEVLTSALLNQSGPLGKLLADVIAYTDDKPESATHSGIDGAILSGCYLKTLVWVNSVIPDIQTE